jgi:hypothetical protein
VAHALFRRFINPHNNAVANGARWVEYDADAAQQLAQLVADGKLGDFELCRSLRDSVEKTDLTLDTPFKRMLKGTLKTYPYRIVLASFAWLFSLSWESFINEFGVLPEAREHLNQICAPIRALLVELYTWDPLGDNESVMLHLLQPYIVAVQQLNGVPPAN